MNAVTSMTAPTLGPPTMATGRNFQRRPKYGSSGRWVVFCISQLDQFPTVAAVCHPRSTIFFANGGKVRQAYFDQFELRMFNDIFHGYYHGEAVDHIL